MAQVQLNDLTGLFDSVVGDQNVNDVTDPAEAAKILEEEEKDGAMEDQENMLDGVQAPAVEGEEASSALQEVLLSDGLITPYAAVPSSAQFTPTAWQCNLASSRLLGEHYLMYAVRDYYSSSGYYWHYYLVLGGDITYGQDIYTYKDCDVYSYYAYNNTVFYTVELDSGSVDGGDHLVYSDLYFDYLGVNPVNNIYPYLIYMMLFIICVLLVIGGRKHV